MWENLILGMSTVLDGSVLLAILVGTAIGIVIGALPGLGPSLGVALLIPFTYSLPPSTSLILLVALYMAAEYGGSISAILISTPGTAAAVATVIDGYALNKKGYPGKALGTSLTSSFIGGLIGTAVLVALSLPLASFALRFGPPEYFALGVFGLAIVSSLSGKSLLKGLLMTAVGLVITTIGVDPIAGVPRFSFGRPELLEGIPLLPALIGLFALAEVFKMMEDPDTSNKVNGRITRAFISLRELRRLLPTILRGSAIGTLVGTVPGAGAAIASWLAYDTEKRLSRHPEEFGKGAMEGIAGPEAANNACVGGALVPLLALGVPGSPTTAILIGAMMLHGLQPGPQLFTKNPDVVYSLFVGLFFACLAMFVLGVLSTRLWMRVLTVPNGVLAPVIFALGVVGAYGVRNEFFDVWLALGFGVAGYLLKKYNFPLAPIVLAMVLGFMVEANLGRALLMSQGSYSIFFTRPLSAVLLSLTVISFVMPLLRDYRRRARARIHPVRTTVK